MSRTLWTWARTLGGAAILAVLVWRLGPGPFVDALRRVDGWSLAAAAGIAAVSTVCCAWRWNLVARGLGIGMPLRTAVAACYRSQFLNTTLPGGVLGDVHRATHHGRDVGDVGRGVRAVVWERLAGQVVQVVIATGVLLALPSPIRPAMPFVAMVLVAGGLGAVVVGRALPRLGPSMLARTMRTAGADLRHGWFARGAWPGIVIASTVAVIGHTVTFLIAARVAGSTASPLQVLPLALLVLLAMGLPTNLAGWGPREGVAAWAFAAAGLGATQGITTAVVYGAMVLVAGLPGGVVLVVEWLRGSIGAPGRASRVRRRLTTGTATNGGAHG